jgi:hypothetical protein
VEAEPGIYVEVLIRAGVGEIWRYTQTPELHERWDLRFSAIDYLPKRSEDEPQRFRYATRISFGVKIEGEGESTGTREDATGTRTSALKFWSADPKSLIREGSGYWRYVPAGDGVRFLTWYDYRARFGAAGRIFDRLLFRPLIGWATAWSFDRLRLWIEKGVPPGISMRLAGIHALARLGIAFTWAWQGLVPKLLWVSPDEQVMLARAGISTSLLPVMGMAELLAAVATVSLWRWRPWFLWNAAAMVLALVPVALHSPDYLGAAFNPVTLNAGMIILSVAGYLAAAELPSAARCLRQPRQGDL